MAKVITPAEIMKKALKNVEVQIKSLLKIEGKVLDSAEIDRNKLTRILELEAQIKELDAKKSSLAIEMNSLKNEVRGSLPGGEKDTVDVLVKGIRVFKFPRYLSTALNQESFLKLARKRKILKLVTEKVVVVNDEKVKQAILDGKLTIEEYVSCVKTDITSVFKIEDNRTEDQKKEDICIPIEEQKVV